MRTIDMHVHASGACEFLPTQLALNALGAYDTGRALHHGRRGIVLWTCSSQSLVL